MARVFFGIDIPPDIRQALVGLSEPITGARWQKPEQLHITLCFIGELSERDVERVREQFQGSFFPAFDLRVRGVGCFGPADHPRNLWAGVEPAASLKALRESIREGLSELGLPAGGARFRPHITLARMRRHPGAVSGFLKKNEALVSRFFRVDTFVLFLSETGGTGSRYSVLHSFPLDAP